MTTTNDNPIDKLDAVIGAMTPGDWLPTVSTSSYETGEHYTCVGVTVPSNRGLAFFIGDDDPEQDVDNARGIATLRNVAPELLAVVRAGRERLARTLEALDAKLAEVLR